MKRLATFRKQVIEGWTVQRIAAVLIVVGVIVFVFGAVSQYCACVGWPNLGDVLNHMIGDFYANVSVDCLSIAFAILVLDRLNGRQEEQELKEQLIRELGSRDNGVALHAVDELRARGWLLDGSLKGAALSYADLHRAYLYQASLPETNLHRAKLQTVYLRQANLQGAYMHRADLLDSNLRQANLLNVRGLSEQQLTRLSHLQSTIMPDGRIYDGRFNLSGDFNIAIKHGNASPENPEAMARWYGVSLEEYLAGQEWAREHLADLRREAGLDPGTGLPVEPTNSVEPQPTNTPAQPTPRRNNHRHKASMIAHRTRR